MHAWCSTQLPMALMSPVSSARGMNSDGGTLPNVGCVHRNNASRTTGCFRERSSTGW